MAVTETYLIRALAVLDEQYRNPHLPHQHLLLLQGTKSRGARGCDAAPAARQPKLSLSLGLGAGLEIELSARIR